MAKTSLSQQKTAGRVMHEFKHGELKSGPSGKGGKVRSRKQAIAIALKESGSSKLDSDRENKRHLARSKGKEAAGKTGQQEREGKSHVGARGQRESSRAIGGKNATTRTAAGKKAAQTRSRKGTMTKAELYERAKARNIPNRSKLTKQQLGNALQ